MHRTLTITVDADWQRQLRGAGKLAQQGIATRQYQGESINFVSPGAFFSHLTTQRWHMLTSLIDRGAMDMQALARHLGRDIKNVHLDADALVQLGLLEKTAQGALHCPYARIDIDMALVPRAPVAAATPTAKPARHAPAAAPQFA